MAIRHLSGTGVRTNSADNRMVAEGVEEAAVDPAGAGEMAVEATKAVAGAQIKKAVTRWKSSSVLECFGCWWKVAEDRGGGEWR